jgi:heavy metal sensor kinase
MSLRRRLIWLYVGFLAATLLVFVAGTAVVMYWQLYAQLDRHAVQDLETVEGLLAFTASGDVRVAEDYHTHPESRLVQERYLEILDPAALVLYRNDRLGARTVGGPLIKDEGINGYSNRADRLSDGTRVLLVSRRHEVAGRPIILRVAYATAPLWRQVGTWTGAAVLVLPLILAVAAVTGHRLARRALLPIVDNAERAERITADRLHDRVPVPGSDAELAHLARVFNGLLARLESSFDQLRRFTSDASHELRTPLTAMRSVGEVSLEQEHTPAEYRNVIGSMLEEVNRLTSLVEALLVVARGDSNTFELHRSIIPVSELVQEATSLLEILIEEKNQQLIVSVDDATGAVGGDRVLLRQALVNLVHNAIKFSPDSSTIHVRAVPGPNGNVVLQIVDNGPGIPAEHHTKVFDRFYRVDQGRTRKGGGAGLGLAIAKWAVEVHGGTLALARNSDGGATFEVQLPSDTAAVG